SRAVTMVAGQRELGLGFPAAFATRVVIAGGGMGLSLWASLRFFPWAARETEPRWERLTALPGLLALAAAGGLLFLVLLKGMGGLHEGEKRRLLEVPLPLKPLLARFL
ncbi:MAG TPA: hypothetical protein VIC87_06205, partial [Vicinamibacteria bacterium]